MRNEEPLFLVLVAIFVGIMFTLSKALPPDDYNILFNIILVGACIVTLIKVFGKKKISAPFMAPNSEQHTLITKYYDNMAREVEMLNSSTPMGTVLMLPVCFFTGLLTLFWWAFFGTFPIFLAIFCAYTGIIYGVGYTSKKYFSMAPHIDKVRSSYMEIAKVEFYDSSYMTSYRDGITTYFVFVRSNGETLKLKVAKHVFDFVKSRATGEGYLVRNSKGKGVYDTYDFIPEGEYYYYY